MAEWPDVSERSLIEYQGSTYRIFITTVPCTAKVVIRLASPLRLSKPRSNPQRIAQLRSRANKTICWTCPTIFPLLITMKSSGKHNDCSFCGISTKGRHRLCVSCIQIAHSVRNGQGLNGNRSPDSTLDEPFKSLHLHQLKSSHRIQDNDILQEALKTLPFKTRRRPTRVHRAIGFFGASEIVQYLARVQPACIGQRKAQRTT